MAAGREKSASISVSVRPELDRGSFAKTMKDLAAINKQYKNIDKAFSAMSKTSLKNIKEINDISTAASKFAKKLGSAASSSFAELQNLKNQLEETHEQAEDLEKIYKAVGSQAEKSKVKDQLDQLHKKTAVLNKTIDKHRQMNVKHNKSLLGMMNTEKKYQKQLKESANYDAGKDFKEGLKNLFRGQGKQGLLQIAGSAKGALGKKAAAGELAGGSGALGMAVGGIGAAGLAVGAFVKLLLSASDRMTDLNKMLLDGKGLANEYGIANGRLTKSIDSIRNASIASSPELLKLGGDSETAMKSVGAFAKEASGSVVKTELQLTKMGGGSLSEGLLEFTKNSIIYGKALGMETTEVSSLMGKMVNDIGIDAQNVQAALGDVVKQAAQSGMPVHKFMDIFHQAIPNLDLFTNRMEELTGVMKMLSKTMDPRSVQNFMQAMGRGFDQMDFQSRLKTALIVGPGNMKKIMSKDIESASKSVADNLGDLGPEFQKAISGPDAQKAIAELAGKAQAQGKSPSQIAQMTKLARYKDLSGGGVLKQASAMRDMGMLGRMKTLESLAGRFTGGDISGLGEHVAKQVGVSEDQYKALLDLKANQNINLSSLARIGRTSSKSINSNLATILKIDRQSNENDKQYEERFQNTMKDMAVNDRKKLKEAIMEASVNKMTSDEAANPRVASMETMAVESTNATMSISDKLSKIFSVLKDNIFSSLMDLVSYLSDLLTDLPSWLKIGSGGIAGEFKKWETKNWGGNKAGKNQYKALNRSLLESDAKGANSKQIAAKYKKELNSGASYLLGDKSKIDKNLNEEKRKELRGHLGNAGLDTDAQNEYVRNVKEFGFEGANIRLDPKQLLKLISSFGMQSANKLAVGPVSLGPENNKYKNAQEREDAEFVAGESDVDPLTKAAELADLPSEKTIVQKRKGKSALSKTPLKNSSTAHSPTAQKKESEAVQTTSSAVTELVGHQQDAQDAASKDYENTADVLAVLKKGIKFNDGWMNSKYSSVVKEATLESFRTALTDFLVAYLKTQGSEGAAYSSAITDPNFTGTVANIRTAKTAQEIEEANKVARAEGKARGGVASYTGLHTLTAGERVLTPGQSAGNKVLNVGGINIHVNNGNPGAIKHAVVQALDEIHRRH